MKNIKHPHGNKRSFVLKFFKKNLQILNNFFLQVFFVNLIKMMKL